MKQRAWCAGVLASFLLGVFVNPAWGQLTELFKQFSPSVGALYAQSGNGSLSFNCTITAVERTPEYVVLLSAWHCVSKDTAYLVTFDGRQFYPANVWMIPHEEVDAQKYPRSYGEPKTDMAFFKASLPIHIPVIPLGTDVGVEAGHRILVIGFPLGITKVRYEGIIAGRLERPGAETDGYLILQSFGAPGSSGTAIVNEATGRVIAVLVSGQSAGSGLPVIFATPIDYKRYLLEVPRTYGTRVPLKTP